MWLKFILVKRTRTCWIDWFISKWVSNSRQVRRFNTQSLDMFGVPWFSRDLHIHVWLIRSDSLRRSKVCKFVSDSFKIDSSWSGEPFFYRTLMLCKTWILSPMIIHLKVSILTKNICPLSQWCSYPFSIGNQWKIMPPIKVWVYGILWRFVSIHSIARWGHWSFGAGGSFSGCGEVGWFKKNSPNPRESLEIPFEWNLLNCHQLVDSIRDFCRHIQNR